MFNKLNDVVYGVVHVPFSSVQRRVAGKSFVENKDVCLLLFNDGQHVFIADKVNVFGSAEWKWVKYSQFRDLPQSTKTILDVGNEGLMLQHHGHCLRTTAVTIKQYLKKGFGKHGKSEQRRDWVICFSLFPHQVVILRNHGDKHVVAAKVKPLRFV